MIIAMLFIMVEKLEAIERFKNRDPLNKLLCSVLTALRAGIQNSAVIRTRASLQGCSPQTCLLKQKTEINVGR